jgi:hypothetical protein
MVEGGLLGSCKEARMETLVKTKRLKKTMLMVAWIWLIYVGLHLLMSSAWAEQNIQQLQGVIMENDAAERVIYVNERKVIVPNGTEITTDRDVRLSFESLRPKQWVFIQAHLQGKSLIADKIVRIPRYIPPKERGGYRFFTETGTKK